MPSPLAGRLLAPIETNGKKMPQSPSGKLIGSPASSLPSSPAHGSAIPSPLARRSVHRKSAIYVANMSQAERRVRMRLAKLSDDELLDLEFAKYGDILRKISWVYLNRPTSSVEKDRAEPDTASSFASLTQTRALLLFAKDMLICPLLLIEEEVTQAIYHAHQKQTRRVNLVAAVERPFMDFLISSAQLALAKKPYCNVFATSSMKEKVQAILAFLPLDESEAVKQITSARFETVNDMVVFQAAAESKIKKKILHRRKWRDVKTAREALRESWKMVYEIFLYFCDRPALLELPDAEKHAAASAEKFAANIADNEQQASVQFQTKTEKKDEEEITAGTGTTLNLMKLVNVHPAIRRARTTASAIKLQTLFRRRFYTNHETLQISLWAPVRSPNKTQASPAVVNVFGAAIAQAKHQGEATTQDESLDSESVSTPATNTTSIFSPSSPEKPAILSAYLGQVDERPSGAAPEICSKTGLLSAWLTSESASESSEEVGGASRWQGSRGPMMLRANGADELLDWLRREVQTTPIASTVNSSVSSVGYVSVPVLNSRVGAWETGRVAVKKSKSAGGVRKADSSSNISSNHVKIVPRVDEDGEHSESKKPPTTSESVVSRLFGIRRLPMPPAAPQPSLPSSSSGSYTTSSSSESLFNHRRPMTAREGYGNAPCTLPGDKTGAQTARAGAVSMAGMMAAKRVGMRWKKGEWHTEKRAPARGEYFGWKGLRTAVSGMRTVQRIWGGKKASIFSDDWKERKAAMEEMHMRDFRPTTKTEIGEDEKQHHEQIIVSWMAGAIRHDKIMENAASMIQRMGRAWLTRKIVREGKFLEDATKGWVEAHPPPPLSSVEATMSLEKLLALARTFGVVPKIVTETQMLEIFYQQTASGQARRVEEIELRLSWVEFERILYSASTWIEQDDTETTQESSELDRLTNLDQLLQIILAPSEKTYDIERPRAWIRQHVVEYAKTNQQAHDEFENKILQTGFQRTPSEEIIHRETAAKIEVSGNATDGSAAYLNSCSQLEVHPIHSLLTQLSEETMNLQHYGLVGNDVTAFAAGLRKNQCIRKLNLCDTRLEADGFSVVCNALIFNTHIQTVDFSENALELSGLKAVADFLSLNSTVQKLVLRGVGLTDDGWDLLVRNGFERNKSLIRLDVTNNLLSDESIDHIEHLILSKAALGHIDLSWNMLSKDACDKIQNAGVERSKPRTSRSAKAGRVQKQLAKIILVAEPRTQRHEMINQKDLSLRPDWKMAKPKWMSTAEFISMDVVLRDRKLTEEIRLRLIRMFVAGKYLQPFMVSQVLKVFFTQAEETVKKKAVDLLLQKLGRAEDVVVVAHDLRPEFDI